MIRSRIQIHTSDKWIRIQEAQKHRVRIQEAKYIGYGSGSATLNQIPVLQKIKQTKNLFQDEHKFELCDVIRHFKHLKLSENLCQGWFLHRDLGIKPYATSFK
jgi:hypothetical protein